MAQLQQCRYSRVGQIIGKIIDVDMGHIAVEIMPDVVIGDDGVRICPCQTQERQNRDEEDGSADPA